MLSSVLSLLSCVSFATADLNKVTLSVESKNSTLDGKFLTALHEGAGISSIFLTSSPQQYVFNSTSNTVSLDLTYEGSYYMIFAELFGSLAASVTGPPYALFEDNYLAINGSQNVFYACNSLSYDPYGYSKSSTGVAVYGDSEKVPSDCQSIKIKGDVGGSVTVATSSASDSESASATSSESDSYSEITESESGISTSDGLVENASFTTTSAENIDAANSTSTRADNSTPASTTGTHITGTRSVSATGSSTRNASSTASSAHSSSRSASSTGSTRSENGAISAGLGGGLVAGIAYFLL